MLERMRRFGRELTGRSGGLLVGHLVDQLEATLAAVRVIRQVAAGELDAASGWTEVDELETVGDDARRALIHELSRTLASPIDREDLFRLSRSVDDVLDNLRDLAREFDLYEVPSEPLLADALANIGAGVVALREAVGCLVDAPEQASRRAAEAKKNDVRLSYQRAMAALLADGQDLTPQRLRRRELLRRVDVTGLRLAEAADALADGAVKRSH
ncbi:MAG: DUF47 family protein [Nitriliruptor sp.]